MSTGSALLLVAALLSVDNGAAQIDQGSLHGLESGDQGQVFYALTVDGMPKRIEVGPATAFRVEEGTSTVRAVSGTVLRAGYEIEFQIPVSRTDPLPGNVGEGHVPSGNVGPVVPSAPPSPDPRAGEALAPSNDAPLEIAPPPAGVEPPLRTNVGEGLAPSRVPDAFSDTVPSPEPSRDSVLISAGAYSVGRDLPSAEFFNQTPRFELQTGALNIDRRPVTVGQYEKAGKSPVGNQVAADPVRAVTWLEAEAYCLSVGGRLPTELEWEIAVQLPDFESPSGLVEWTGSWYSPYPRNAHPEEAYGETSRVLRGAPQGVTFDPHARRFMAPEQRNSSVGFRCAFSEGAR